MKRATRTRAFSSFIFFHSLLFGFSLAWGQSDHNAKLVEGAKKEGELTWYVSMSLTESKPLLDDFQKKYPFIKGELFRASTEKVMNRILTETRAGQ